MWARWVLLSGCIFFMAAAHAESSAWTRSAISKAERGAANLALGWMEIPANTVRTYNESGLAFALFGGVVKGVVHTVGRTLVGAFDLLTCYTPTKPLAQGVYPWNAWARETRYGPIESELHSKR